MTRKILEQAREQRDEMEQEEEAAGGSTAAGRATVALLGMNVRNPVYCTRSVRMS